MTAHPATKSMIGLVDVLRKAATRGRTERYLGRLDEHMADMDRGERLTFLRGELAKFEARYQRFQRAVFAGQNMEGDVSAWDYAETIAVIATRIARIEREAVAA